MGKMEDFGQKDMEQPKDQGVNRLTPMNGFIITIIEYHRITDSFGNCTVLPVKTIIKG